MSSHASSNVSTHQQPMHLWDYWNVIMKRLLLVVLFVSASVAIAWFVTENQEPTYRATATVKIIPPAVRGGSDLFAPAIFTDDRYLDTMVEELKMPATVERAVRAQKLSQNRDFQGRSDGDIVKMAVNRVEVGLRRNKLLMDVSVTGPDPKVLPHLANALVREFQAMQQSESRTRRENARTELESKIQRLTNDERVAQTEKRIQLEAKKYNEQTFDFEFEFNAKRLQEYTTERDRTSRELARDRGVYDAFKTWKEKNEAKDVLLQLPVIRQDLSYQSLDAEIARLHDRLGALRRDGVGSGNEAYKRVEQDIVLAEAARDRWLVNRVDGFLMDYAAKVNYLADLDRELYGIKAKVEEIVTLKGTIDAKNADIEEKRAERALLQKQLDPIIQDGWEDPDLVKISQTAREPTEPFSPNRSQNLTLGAIIGVLGGVALAFLLDYLDDTIRTKDELAKIADVPLLGIVPNIGGGGSDTSKRDLFAHHQPKSTISEAYRGVRTALTLSAEGPMQKVLLLTSAGPREGKSTTAINLATVLAYSGGRTLLIDADLRKPRVHKSFGIANMRGLTNLIIGTDDPVGYCQPSIVERVDVLPSGPIPPNPSELLGHPRMREILRRLREVYDHIIIDTPPIGAVTDAAVLATIADGVILVVHAGKTRRQIVQRGLEQLRYINARIVGVILNNLRVGRIRYYPGYYHYYYYYSSHYGAEEAPPEETKAAAREDGKA